MRFEIFVEVNDEQYQLDTYEYDPISLNFNIADIQDISKRNSSYSKTIKLPETSNNRIIFGDLGDLDVYSSFNPNLRTKCTVLVDTIPVFVGYLQVKSIMIDKDTRKKEYEIVIFADNENFFTLLGDSFISDLDFSELNHKYTADNIINSWTQSWNHGYFYPLIDYGNNWDYTQIQGQISPIGDLNYVRIDQMFPATNVKYIFKKILQNVGYTYESDFLDTDTFEDLYLPFNRASLQRNPNSLDYKFSIGMLAGFTQSKGGGNLVGQAPPNPNFVQVGRYRIPFNNENSPYGDPTGYYNTTTYEYVAPLNPDEIVSQRFVCDFDITFLYRFRTDYNRQTGIGSGFWANSICFKRQRVGQVGSTTITTNNSLVPAPFNTTTIPNLQFFGTNNERVIGQVSTPLIKLLPGEKVWVEVQYWTQTQTIWPGTLTASSPVIVFNKNNVFYNNVNLTVLPGEVIPYNQVVPLNMIKQKDFIMSLVRMFNLYIEPSKEWDRTLIIEPRDEYYAKGQIKDWTKKIHIKSIESTLLANTQNKKNIFKYKDDSDFFNVDYRTNQANVSYGEKQYFIDNDFISSETKVELAFSPTPLVQVPNSRNLVIPKIGKINNNVFSPTTHNIRILTKYRPESATTWDFTTPLVIDPTGYIYLQGSTAHSFKVGDVIRVTQNDNYASNPAFVLYSNPVFQVIEIYNSTTIGINLLAALMPTPTAIAGKAITQIGLVPTQGDDTWGFADRGANYIWKAYPYLGHLNHPFQPNYDLNYEQVRGYYYPEDSITNNNLFELYWSAFYEECSDIDSRMITAEFDLDAIDIASFRFNDNIYISNQYYRVNKIKDYDPGMRKLTQVELIKAKFITVPKTVRRSRKPQLNPDTIGPGRNTTIRPVRGFGLVVSNPDNATVKGDVLIGGTKNTVSSNKVLIVGDNNIVSSDDNYIMGNNNTVDTLSDGNIIIGDNNSVFSGVEKTFVFGQGQQVVESRSFIVNGKFIISADIVDAGRNEVLNRFPDSKMNNYLSASRNEVRELGSVDIVNIVSGGRFNANS
jgi:hypothetical protein